ncbi:B12-binding domain-containing radical SAM protein [Pelagibius marinus]|uniref:B12-binding domain-containing radical SAM protein n=1 Tax=Pelagibius marinus TaxID=2762760 RepID=UPI0018727789|nr:radical SAM protein [Pelagibius marinus]
MPDVAECGAATGAESPAGQRKFQVTLIKPSHYDKDGYVIQWWKAWIPSNSLAALYGLVLDAEARRALGPDVEIEIDAYDEMNILLPFKDIIARHKAAEAQGGGGLICLVGVQSNQYPRALHIAKRFREAGLQVAIGGFHVSGCLSMLPGIHESLQEALDMGCSLFAGEAEEHLDRVLNDALKGTLEPVYNTMAQLPDLQGAVTPFLPEKLVRRYDGVLSSFDAGRGCPFQCSFCTIINVQGRKSRYRSADDIEKLIRANYAQGVTHYFITDDNFARNKNWEAIFDRMAELREEGIDIRFLIQVDVLAHKIPNFIEKAKKAGCKQVFIGLESINPENLKEMKKNQNKITEYRTMFQQWRAQQVVTYAGFIMGLPNDTPQTIKRDIEIIQREIPVDVLEITILTPLPGSEDHKNLYTQGVWMDPDLNKYDLECVTFEHSRMSREELQQAYWDAWDHYYTLEHAETLMRRAVADGIKPVRIWQNLLQIYGAMGYERVHPQQCGYFRRRVRSERRPELPRENALIFFPKNVARTLRNYAAIGLYAWRLHRLRRRVEKDPAAKSYSDPALTPVIDHGEDEELEMYHVNKAAEAAVAKAKAEAEARERHQAKRAKIDAAE